jgi:hypothetical protein
MSTKEETTATTVRAMNDALNARDREATAALFAPDGVFRPGAAGASFPTCLTDSISGCPLRVLTLAGPGRHQLRPGCCTGCRSSAWTGSC